MKQHYALYRNSGSTPNNIQEQQFATASLNAAALNFNNTSAQVYSMSNLLGK